MEGEIITTLADKGAIGVIILAVVAIVYLVRVFLKHISEQSILAMTTHKETTNTMATALKEVTSVVSEMHSSNEKEHETIKGKNSQILTEIKDLKQVVRLQKP